MKLFKIISVTFFTLLLATQANAFFKCDKGFVDEGDSKGVVRAKCGQPVYEDKDSGDGSVVLIESWTYNNYGGKGWMTTLHFEKGRLKEIESLGRVK